MKSTIKILAAILLLTFLMGCSEYKPKTLLVKVRYTNYFDPDVDTILVTTNGNGVLYLDVDGCSGGYLRDNNGNVFATNLLSFQILKTIPNP
jgi:hypothetical protein